ncbi:MAG: hypothetical protein SFZ23_02515 [Planctomycetota bacterium]|nr:hypothetical protein [Planctomycetota bacterium]
MHVRTQLPARAESRSQGGLFRADVPEECGNAPGDTLIIGQTVPNADSGTYRVRVNGPCGEAYTDPFTLQVLCPADFNGDGMIDFFDYLDFVLAMDAGC